MRARILFDGPLAGSRNVFIAVGSGRLHLYEQPPRDSGHGAIHHLGIRIQGLKKELKRLQAEGLNSRTGLREQETWRYVMVEAPDGLLLELFEFDDPSAPANWKFE